MEEGADVANLLHYSGLIIYFTLRYIKFIDFADLSQNLISSDSSHITTSTTTDIRNAVCQLSPNEANIPSCNVTTLNYQALDLHPAEIDIVPILSSH